ncbi:MAG: hypothetical protein JW779_14955 [Candidatus Thorarchaeota archaeon]|nr:hypothetical protein [Candidatus Thorarchaeota archaeon]
MLDRTMDCDDFKDKEIRKRCEEANDVILRHADEIHFLSKSIAQVQHEIDLALKEINDYTMKGILPPPELEDTIDRLEQNKAVLVTERYIKESERDIKVIEKRLGAKDGEIMTIVKDQLKKTGKTLADRAKVGEILSEARQQYKAARGVTPIISSVPSRSESKEPSIDHLIRLEARGAKLHPDWQKKLDAYRKSKGTPAKRDEKEDTKISFEDEA